MTCPGAPGGAQRDRGALGGHTPYQTSSLGLYGRLGDDPRPRCSLSQIRCARQGRSLIGRPEFLWCDHLI